MRIAKITIPQIEAKKVNLKEINLTKKSFGSIVALVGKNGAGKSRVLKFVENYINNFDLDKYIDGHIVEFPSTIISQYAQNIKLANQSINNLKKDTITQQQSQQTKTVINQQLGSFFTRFRQLGKAYIKIVDNDELKNIKNNINNSKELTFEQILANNHFDNFISNTNQQQQQQNISLNEFNSFNNQSTINYLTKLTDEIITDEFNLYIKYRKTPEKINDEMKEKKSFLLFDKFQKNVKQFLGKEFSYQQNAKGNIVNSTLYYNNEPFDLNLFSPGQKTLFAYAILFFYLDTNSKTNINECIIIIDEPEKHLHPEAQITLINALKSIISKSGQLWIATHSIHILSHLQYDEILMVKDDEIIPPSRTTPGKSFNDLMGIDDHISELISFINSISEWAYGNFMLQCFKQPEVIFDINTNDPQFKLFKDFLKDKTTINLLDFGAGKGRIGYTLQEDEDISKKIKYYAFEPDKSNFELLNNVPNLKSLYSEMENIPENNFDCILLCNVLHEINPKEWINIFTSIKKTLNDNGYLIIIEDRFLPKGETAHEFGYLILGTSETRILFNTENSLELKLNEPDLTDRIVFNAFKKEEINLTEKSILDSINLLKTNTFNNLKTLKNNKNSNHGRRYANETQLYINSQLTLEYLKKVKSTKV
ncbi:AAA family ATPase [Flavobacterium granuli]|uniref:Energy-coupling factor transporter ATP-binding protein EcfA2 n=1 Tax=Flavobacterium granuli TaxID=280093 RepID=A0ABU1RZL3_9FLAO|nr:AAA family ATPase [Flavobacterium granuli]MDR6844199.1 energy-coupling factor transporter ATP-binding protein EcfA2 [Flavobacterium granuli]